MNYNEWLIKQAVEKAKAEINSAESEDDAVEAPEEAAALDPRKDKKVSMNRQVLEGDPFFAIRKNQVKWPTIRKVFMDDDNVAQIKKYATGKGRSIVFLDGTYETKLNRYVGKSPVERAVFFEFMLKDKNISGAIFILCWIGNFHNGCIFHAAPQFPQMNCWVEALGQEKATLFFEKHAFKVYKEIVNILHGGGPIIDDEVRKFIENGNKII